VLPDDGYTLLHEVRLRGLVTVDDNPIVELLISEGLVARARASIRLTSDGRAAHAVWARVPPGSELESTVARGYERFLPLNVEFLRVCHDWQVRPGEIPNDHGDAPYDWAVLDRLRTIDERTAPVVRRVARDVARFDGYARRLRTARARVDEGEQEWFTSPRIDSYHTVWMQLHEDLLLALGRAREDEPEP
jgi:hypothetical protein